MVSPDGEELEREGSSSLAILLTFSGTHLPIPSFASTACRLLMTHKLTYPSPSTPPSSTSASSRTTVTTPLIVGRMLDGTGLRFGRCKKNSVDSARTAAMPILYRMRMRSTGFPAEETILLATN